MYKYDRAVYHAVEKKYKAAHRLASTKVGLYFPDKKVFRERRRQSGEKLMASTETLWAGGWPVVHHLFTPKI